MLNVSFDVSQGFLDVQGVACINARTDKRFLDERAIFLQMILAFSKPLDLELGICDRFKSKTNGLLWNFQGDFVDWTAITIFDLSDVPHVVINASAHRRGETASALEFMDSLGHEMTHATGPLLGRWSIDLQPNLSNVDESESNTLSYAIEEFVAITTAVKLYPKELGISIEKADEIRSSGIKTMMEQLRLTSAMETQIDWDYIESSSQKVVDFLTLE
jgi:hypothetical protein